MAQRDLNPLIYENLPLILEVLVSLLKFIQVTDEEKRRQKVKNPEKFKDPDISKADFEKLKKFLADPNCNMEKEAENMECIANENEFSAPEEEKESYDSNETESEDSNPDIFTDFVDLVKNISFTL